MNNEVKKLQKPEIGKASGEFGSFERGMMGELCEQDRLCALGDEEIRERLGSISQRTLEDEILSKEDVAFLGKMKNCGKAFPGQTGAVKNIPSADVLINSINTCKGKE